MTTFDPQNISLTESQVACLTFIEQEYMLHKAVPTVELMADVIGVSKETVRKWLNSPEFDHYLRMKGIYLSRKREGVLAPQQLIIANMLLNVDDRRSKRQKCEEAGISVQQLNAWYRDAQFSEYVRKLAEEKFGDGAATAYLTILKNMENGDMVATKLFMEMSGRYTPSVRHDVNLDSFVGSLLEILQYRIADPQTLELIAGDLESLLSGKPVTIQQAPVPASEPKPQKAIEAKSVEKPMPAFKLDLG